MFNPNALFTRTLLALALAGGAGAAFAGPTYHVSVNTAAFSGSGYLDLGLGNLGGAAPVTATLSNFHGSFGTDAITMGTVGGDVGSSVSIVNDESFNDLLQAVNLGGLFSFDVSFDVGAGDIGSTFAVALVNAALDAYLGVDGNIATIDLMPGAPDVVSTVSDFASVSTATANVPEPAALSLLVTGLLLLALMARRRQQR